jgi:hypothetical protein
MRAEDKRDLLFAFIAGEGFVNLMAAWALLLLVAHGARPERLTAPAIAFVASAVLLLITCAGADLLRETRETTAGAPGSGQRRTR